jgi:hypothetical protein
VKLLKILIVPAVLLFSVVMAAPASAHGVTGAKVTPSCENGQICVTLEGTTVDGTAKRIVDLQLFGDDTKVGEAQLTVPAFDANNPHFTVKACFPAVTSGNFTKFTVKVVDVVDSNGNDADLTVQDEHGHQLFSFADEGETPAQEQQEDQQNDDAVVLLKDLAACSAPSPSPSPPTSPSTSPSATTTTTLANTGGFDFRFPLIGLILLVAGGTLYVIGASRGRSTTK